MSPRPDVSDERKSQILNAAEEVFTEKGFDQARMDDIAGQTGLSKGTLYLYFKSKDDLIIAILDRLFQREFRQMEKLIVADKTARACVEEFTDLATRDISAMLRLLPIFYQFLALAFRNKYVQHALKQYLNRFLDVLIPIIQRGIDSWRVSRSGCARGGAGCRGDLGRHYLTVDLRQNRGRSCAQYSFQHPPADGWRPGAVMPVEKILTYYLTDQSVIVKNYASCG